MASKPPPCYICGVRGAALPLAYCVECWGRARPGLDLVGIVEIASRAKVTRDAIHKWRERHADFPTPEAVLSATPVWRWSSVEAWLRATGRLT